MPSQPLREDVAVEPVPSHTTPRSKGHVEVELLTRGLGVKPLEVFVSLWTLVAQLATEHVDSETLQTSMAAKSRKPMKKPAMTMWTRSKREPAVTWTTLVCVVPNSAATEAMSPLGEYAAVLLCLVDVRYCCPSCPVSCSVHC